MSSIIKMYPGVLIETRYFLRKKFKAFISVILYNTFKLNYFIPYKMNLIFIKVP